MIAALVALCCLGFAVLNVAFEVTDHFADGRYADHAAALSVMNWLVLCLKAVGAVVALLSILGRPRVVPAAAMTVLLWGAFGTLAVYSLGSVVQAIGMATGVTGTADDIDLAGIGYVLCFLVVAAGYGVLAVSFSRRHGTRTRLAVLGVLGAPVVLGLLLVTVPALLTTLELMPAS